MVFKFKITSEEARDKEFLRCWENCGHKGFIHRTIGRSILGKRRSTRRSMERSGARRTLNTNNRADFRCWLVCARDAAAARLNEHTAEGNDRKATKALERLNQLNARIRRHDGERQSRVSRRAREQADALSSQLGRVRGLSDPDLLAELETLSSPSSPERTPQVVQEEEEVYMNPEEADAFAELETQAVAEMDEGVDAVTDLGVDAEQDFRRLAAELGISPSALEQNGGRRRRSRRKRRRKRKTKRRHRRRKRKTKRRRRRRKR